MVGHENKRNAMNTAWAQDNNPITAKPLSYFWRSSCCNSPTPQPGCACTKKCRNRKITRSNTENLISRSMTNVPTADFSKTRVVPETRN